MRPSVYAMPRSSVARKQWKLPISVTVQPLVHAEQEAHIEKVLTPSVHLFHLHLFFLKFLLLILL